MQFMQTINCPWQRCDRVYTRILIAPKLYRYLFFLSCSYYSTVSTVIAFHTGRQKHTISNPNHMIH